MDTTALIGIIIVIVALYFIIKFIVSPLIKIIVGVIAILLLIYLLQRFLGFNMNNILSHFRISSDFSFINKAINGIFNLINYYINQFGIFINMLWDNISKTVKIKD